MTISPRSIVHLVLVSLAACDPIILGDLGTGTTSDGGDDNNPSSSPPDTDDTDTADTADTVEVSSDDGPVPDLGDGGEMSSSSGAQTTDGEAHSACDLYVQDCPDDEKCMPWADDGGDAWSGAGCFPADVDPAWIGEACIVEGSAVSGIDNCAAGTVCYDVDPKSNEGTCAQLCDAEADPVCLDPETQCVPDPSGITSVCVVP